MLHHLTIQGVYKKKEKEALNKKVREMMDLVGLAQRFVNSYSWSRRTALPSVDFPQPDSPTTPRVSPFAISKLTSSTA